MGNKYVHTYHVIRVVALHAINIYGIHPGDNLSTYGVEGNGYTLFIYSVTYTYGKRSTQPYWYKCVFIGGACNLLSWMAMLCNFYGKGVHVL